jgi:hypothetical protein
MSARPHKSFHERMFALTLYLYPRRFRDEFGEPMLQTLRDRCRDRGTSGVVSSVRELALLLSTRECVRMAPGIQCSDAGE